MTKTYECKYCKFQTLVKTNFKSHCETLKHLDKIRDLIIKCEYCNYDIDKLEIVSHYAVCANKELVDKVISIKIAEAVNATKINLETCYDAKLTKLGDTHRTEIKKLLKKNDNVVTYQNRERRKEFENLKQQSQEEIKTIKKEK